MTLLDTVKKMMHYPSGTSYDDEIKQNIEACKSDLIRSGVLSEMIIETDPAIINCISSFCESRMADINEREKYINIYKMFKSELLVSSDYHGAL